MNLSGKIWGGLLAVIFLPYYPPILPFSRWLLSVIIVLHYYPLILPSSSWAPISNIFALYYQYYPPPGGLLAASLLRCYHHYYNLHNHQCNSNQSLFFLIILCFKGPARLCRFCFFSILLPITFLCVPLYMRCCLWWWWLSCGDDHCQICLVHLIHSTGYDNVMITMMMVKLTEPNYYDDDGDCDDGDDHRQVCVFEAPRVHPLPHWYETSQSRTPGEISLLLIL